jgi:nucleotide-binding universal stress UspA family protein
MYRNILIATDGSGLADRAVAQGLALAKALGARVTAVTVTQQFPTSEGVMLPNAGDVRSYEEIAASAARRILDQVEASAAELGVPCTAVHVADDWPAEGILKTCQEQGCDAIVMATHGRRGIDRVLLGSQAAKVVKLGKVSVLVCR